MDVDDGVGVAANDEERVEDDAIPCESAVQRQLQLQEGGGDDEGLPIERLPGFLRSLLARPGGQPVARGDLPGRALALARRASTGALARLREPVRSVASLVGKVHRLLTSTTITRQRSIRRYSADFIDTWSERLRCGPCARCACAFPAVLTHPAAAAWLR